jgi:DNA-directed RNA polymerase specialized sigma24 family protein
VSHAIPQSDLQILQFESDVAARRLIRKLRLPYDDLADLRQELLLDLFARLKAFDPERGSLGAFAGIVMANKATRIANKVKRDRRLYGAVPASLDETLPDSDGATRGDLVAEEDGLAAYLGQVVDAFAEVERRLDVARGLGILDPDDSTLCAALSRTTIDRLAGGGRGARSSLYRRVKDIRLALLAAGLRAA